MQIIFIELTVQHAQTILNLKEHETQRQQLTFNKELIKSSNAIPARIVYGMVFHYVHARFENKPTTELLCHYLQVQCRFDLIGAFENANFSERQAEKILRITRDTILEQWDTIIE